MLHRLQNDLQVIGCQAKPSKYWMIVIQACTTQGFYQELEHFRWQAATLQMQ